MVGGRYRLSGWLGRGGMGAVWEAHDTLLGRDVALKEIYLPEDGAGPDDPMIRRAFREARAAARLRHRGIVTVHDVVTDDGRPWIVMELIDGPSLAAAIRQHGTLAEHWAADIGAQVLDALRAAHRQGVLHRDVKPANILLGTDRVVLTDFGIAAIDDATSITSTGQMIGSPAFLAPERLDGQPATAATDLWALGVTLYTAVTGRSPFPGGDLPGTLAAILNRSPEPPPDAGLLWPVIEGLLAKDPDDRLTADQAYPLLRAVVRASGEQTGGASREQTGGAQGVQAGAASGKQAGAAQGEQVGAAQGEQAGVAFGEQAGAASGGRTAAASGERAGVVQGEQPGSSGDAAVSRSGRRPASEPQLPLTLPEPRPPLTAPTVADPHDGILTAAAPPAAAPTVVTPPRSEPTSGERGGESLISQPSGDGPTVTPSLGEGPAVAAPPGTGPAFAPPVRLSGDRPVIRPAPAAGAGSPDVHYPAGPAPAGWGAGASPAAAHAPGRAFPWQVMWMVLLVAGTLVAAGTIIRVTWLQLDRSTAPEVGTSTPAQSSSSPAPPGSPSPESSEAVPGAFLGEWSGTAKQPIGTVASWEVVITFAASARTGSFFTSLNCTGTLTVVAPWPTDQEIHLHQRTGWNPRQTCVDEADITLTLDDDGRMEMRWQDSGNPSNQATASLTRS
ncbi:serine/threonine protein kinase [Actinoplanes xinjiangensis]|uniref:non-specific serine/threonine protein kinase n=1 Tax=Actinoplanes xinjiangensis TaxID=512350 RepID=A0A316FK04_9ACTN|nr:serine/threonine protein kinase [Actinoplanes xinjiangensis]